MFGFTVKKAIGYFERLGLNVNITLRGKTLTIEDTKYKVPEKGMDTWKKIKWDDKVEEQIRELIPADKAKEVTDAYTEVLETLKKSTMGNSFSYTNWGPTEPASIKRTIQNMRDFLKMVDSMENLDKTLDDYEAYRILADRRFGSIENE